MCGRCFEYAFSPSIFSPKAALREPVGCHQFLGDLSEEDPPVPIPNTEVKLLSPDGTARASVWESRKSPGLIQKPPLNDGGFFIFSTPVSARFSFAPASRPVCYIRIAFDKLPRVRPSVYDELPRLCALPDEPRFQIDRRTRVKNIFVGNLDFNATEEAVRSLFERYGQVNSARIMTDRETGRSRGFAFVEMENEGEADQAISALNGYTLDGRA